MLFRDIHLISAHPFQIECQMIARNPRCPSSMQRVKGEPWHSLLLWKPVGQMCTSACQRGMHEHTQLRQREQNHGSGEEKRLRTHAWQTDGRTDRQTDTAPLGDSTPHWDIMGEQVRHGAVSLGTGALNWWLENSDVSLTCFTDTTLISSAWKELVWCTSMLARVRRFQGHQLLSLNMFLISHC